MVSQTSAKWWTLSVQSNSNFSFDEISVGQSEVLVQHITAETINGLADLSGDHSAIHVREDAARAAGHAGQVAHGVLSQCFFSALIGTRLPGDSALLLELTSRFRLPVLAGDTVTYEGKVAELHESTRCITLKLAGTNQHGQKVVVGKALVRVQK